MYLSVDLRRRAGLLLWAASLLFACWKTLDAGHPAEPPSREQRVAVGFAKLREAGGHGQLVLLGDSITAGRRWRAGPAAGRRSTWRCPVRPAATCWAISTWFGAPARSGRC